MTTSFKLEAFASDPDWMSFGKALTAAMQTPESYGFTDTNQLLAEVASLRGVDASSLRNPLAAVHWMTLHAPEGLKAESGGIAMTGVLSLSQISFLNSALASKLAKKYFSGQIKRTHIQEALKRVQDERGGRGGLAHERVKQVVAFETAVVAFLNNHPDVLKLGGDIKIVHGDRKARVPADLIVVRHGEPIAAIEVKSHRQKRHNKFLLETLAMASLLSREYSTAILITPDSWGDTIGTMADLIQDLRLENLRLATFREGGGAKEHARFRYTGDHPQG